MSAEPLGATAGIPPGELAIAQRVRQLQTLIEQSREVSIDGATPNFAIGGSSQAPSGSIAAGVPAQASGSFTAGAPAQAQGSFAAALQAATVADSTPAAPPGTTDASAGSSQYDPLIEQSAARYGLDPAVLHGLIQQESGFDPESQSSAGAAGLTQLMPGTASSLGVANPLNPAESIEGGARYLSQMMERFGGNTEDALAAYNAGPGAVQQYGGIPPYAETQSYVQKVLGYAEAYRQAHATPSPLGVAA
jgi:soluble lytic murein transglycosylase-like protein